jgi:hypothetical protein
MTIFKREKCEPKNKDSKVPMSRKASLNMNEMFINFNTSPNPILKPNKFVDQITVSYNQFRFKQIINN